MVGRSLVHHFHKTLYHLCHEQSMSVHASSSSSSLERFQENTTLHCMHFNGVCFSPSQNWFIKCFINADWLLTPTIESQPLASFFALVKTSNCSSKIQKVVSQSCTKVEYCSFASAISNVLWLQMLLQELKVPSSPPTIYSDNQCTSYHALTY